MEGMIRGQSLGQVWIALAWVMIAAGVFPVVCAAAEDGYDDAELELRARSRLERRVQLRGLPIEVSIRSGIGLRKGSVNSLEQAEMARRAVAGVRGLVDLQSALEVPAGMATDSELRGYVEEEIERFPVLERLELRIDVKEGRAVIEGEVRSAGQRLLALEAARRVEGVRGVDLRLRVRGGQDASDGLVQDQIRDLLGDRLRFPIQGQVSARVRDRIAILEGEVQRVIDRLDAEQLAWYVGGVLSVQNLIKVVPRSRIRSAHAPRGDETAGTVRPLQSDPETPEDEVEE